MDKLEKLKAISANPYKYAEAWKADSQKKVVGSFCSYTPEELIHAAGALPFRLFGTQGNISLAHAHLQSYSCSLVRGALEEALLGRLNFLDATVFPHTCDSMQRLSDIWRLNAGVPRHIDVVMPVKMNSKAAQDYMIDIMKKFKRDLEKALDVEITNKMLKQAVTLFNQIRENMDEIFRLKASYPAIIEGKDFYSILKAGMIMDRAEFLADITVIAPELMYRKHKEQSPKKRIILTGAVCNHLDLYSIIEESGGVVVWDDLCMGKRYYEGEIPLSSDPFQAIGRRYIDRIVCPAKHAGITARGDNLLRLVKAHHIEGAIFLILKFCDPQCFDYPYMKEYLDRENIPNMLLEIEEQLAPSGQLRTKFEAFIDML